MPRHIVIERPGLVGFLPHHLVFNGLVVECFRFALVGIEIPARLFLCLLGHHEVVVGPPRNPAYLRSNRRLHRVQVAANLGYLRIGWTELRREFLQLPLQARLLQAKVLNQIERSANAGGGRAPCDGVSAQPRDQLRVAALNHLVDRALEDAVRLRLRFGLGRHLKLVEDWVIDLIFTIFIDLAHSKDTSLLLQLHHLRL